MRLLETIIVAFSMFSALPMPAVEWNEKNRKYSLCAFPLIGAVIGLCCWLWMRLCQALAIPPLLRGAVLCALPVLLTGGVKTVADAQRLLQEGKSDLIGVGRALFRDAHWRENN